MSDDSWDDIASEQIVSPRRARMRAAEKRKQKRLQERNELFRAWERWHKERREILLSGPHGRAAQELVDFLERMTCCEEDAAALLTLVQQGPWADSDPDVKFLVLGVVDNAITYLRENEGLHPFDDPLPDEEPNVFLTIREMLR
jgi:hypothetical protein